MFTQIISILKDEPRRGNPGKFSLEEIVQIIAVACEIPATSERPVSHWTPKELADEVVKRKIVSCVAAYQTSVYPNLMITPNLVCN
ncbi:helix-turn-helix domain-containing protein [Nostoc flagelliforme]|uniref:helix-turn-helix domain-containing protein n=1 Tax=Nostoc flagelliforme TaxID=1306274 RepID=UPI0012FE6B67